MLDSPTRLKPPDSSREDSCTRRKCDWHSYNFAAFLGVLLASASADRFERGLAPVMAWNPGNPRGFQVGFQGNEQGKLAVIELFNLGTVGTHGTT